MTRIPCRRPRRQLALEVDRRRPSDRREEIRPRLRQLPPQRPRPSRVVGQDPGNQRPGRPRRVAIVGHHVGELQEESTIEVVVIRTTEPSIATNHLRTVPAGPAMTAVVEGRMGAADTLRPLTEGALLVATEQESSTMGDRRTRAVPAPDHQNIMPLIGHCRRRPVVAISTTKGTEDSTGDLHLRRIIPVGGTTIRRTIIDTAATAAAAWQEAAAVTQRINEVGAAAVVPA